MTAVHDAKSPGDKATRAEGVVQIVIMLAIGCAAGAASFTHVHDVAAAHGQDSWLAWADAVVLELMSIASGLELRRRKRHGKSAAFPAAVLVVAVVLSLAAQVVEAESSVIGWIAAALPAVGFLAMVKIALGHSARGRSAATDEMPALANGREPHSDGRTDDSDTVADRPIRTATRPVRRTHRTGTVDSADTRQTNRTALEAAARAVHVALLDEGMPLTRDALAARLRDWGHTVSNSRASDLVKLLRAKELAVTSTAPTAPNDKDRTS